MPKSSRSAAEFNQRLAALADRLASHDIVVSLVHADWGSFGSWEMWVQPGPAYDAYAVTIPEGIEHPTPAPEVLRVTWDGRDGLLGMSVSTPARFSAPANWVSLDTRKLRGWGDSFDEAEHLILTRLGSEA